MQIFLFTAARQPQKRQQHQQHEQHHQERPKNAGKAAYQSAARQRAMKSEGKCGEMGEKLPKAANEQSQC